MGEAKRRKQLGLANRPVLKVTRLELPPLELREKIARAVHEAICAETESDGSDKCLYYARVGALIARKYIGRDYRWEVGEIYVGCSADAEQGDPMFAMVPRLSGYNGLEFHAWFRAKGDDEYVDLSFRHLPTLAQRPTPFGKVPPWTRTGAWPEFFWGFEAELYRKAVWITHDKKMQWVIASKDDEPETNQQVHYIGFRAEMIFEGRRNTLEPKVREMILDDLKRRDDQLGAFALFYRHTPGFEQNKHVAVVNFDDPDPSANIDRALARGYEFFGSCMFGIMFGEVTPMGFAPPEHMPLLEQAMRAISKARGWPMGRVKMTIKPKEQ
jgi:hypothetical protein